MIDIIKEREWLYRSLRTFLQAFISTLSAQLMLSAEGGFDRKLLFSVLVSSIAAGLAAIMNADKKGSDDIE